jgi:hypothetical protein
MPVRTYQNFEAGRTRINVERVHAIAQILDADAPAIFAAVELGSPEFAVRAADNKLVLAELDLDGLGDALAILSGRAETVELLDRLRQAHGDDPAAWLPRFRAMRPRGWPAPVDVSPSPG